MSVRNTPYSRHVLQTVGLAIGLELVLVLGLFGYRAILGEATFLSENTVAATVWLVPYAVLLGPILLIPMRNRAAALYSKGAIFLTIGITLPHLYFLSIPKTPANAQAGILLFLTLPIAGTIYLLLLGILALDHLLSE